MNGLDFDNEPHGPTVGFIEMDSENPLSSTTERAELSPTATSRFENRVAGLVT